MLPFSDRQPRMRLLLVTYSDAWGRLALKSSAASLYPGIMRRKITFWMVECQGKKNKKSNANGWAEVTSEPRMHFIFIFRVGACHSLSGQIKTNGFFGKFLAEDWILKNRCKLKKTLTEFKADPPDVVDECHKNLAIIFWQDEHFFNNVSSIYFYFSV